MEGRLYGIGVGPGDPELLTLKALRLICRVDVIAVPGTKAKSSVAYRIAEQAVELAGEEQKNLFLTKELLSISMPMEKDEEKLRKAHDMGAELIREHLEAGKKVAFLTLGDPTVYSTYLYIHKSLTRAGYQTEIVSGVPSFCSVAARLNMGLVEQAEPLHVIPASYSMESLDEAIGLPGTKVLMKAGKCMRNVKEKLLHQDADIYMIENCGMTDEKIYDSVEQIPDVSSYYSLIIMKDKKTNKR